MRFEFINFPYIKEYGLKPFLSYELVFYPSLTRNKISRKTLKAYTRHSFGFGIALPLNNMINLMIYYNFANLNTNKGMDFERHNIINLNLGFFWLNKKVKLTFNSQCVIFSIQMVIGIQHHSIKIKIILILLSLPLSS